MLEASIATMTTASNVMSMYDRIHKLQFARGYTQ